MPDTETLSEKLASQDYLEAGMIAAALEYWFSDQGHIRSPFPEEIRKELAVKSASAMLTWTNQLNDQAKKELNTEMLAEKFEEILFETGLQMVNSEDEKITIRYPFMPRKGDVLEKKDDAGNALSKHKVSERRIVKKEDQAFLQIELKDINSNEISSEEFELPE